ncbi:MAG: hypothetical protein II897_10900 [Clostridia bacterium]|nr:hypothetical protein [Clostridia bacterium]
MILDYSKHDLIISLKTGPLAVPDNNDPCNSYIALGHFDSATISIADDNAFTRFQNSNGENGAQNNYLIHYPNNISKPRYYPFRFLMSIAINSAIADGKDLSCIADVLHKQLLARIGDDICWSIYFPIARGDISIILSGNDFVKATDYLYKFVHNNNRILYSYTIPLISWEWIRSNKAPSATEISDTFVRTRATVKHYDTLFNFANGIGLPRQEKVSFGTDDVFIDWGQYSEAKIKQYYTALLNLEGSLNQLYKKSAYSTELEISKTPSEINEDIEKRTAGPVYEIPTSGDKINKSKELINKVFSRVYLCNDTVVESLKRLFLSQLFALYRIADLGFFTTLATSFGNAMDSFLETVQTIENHPSYKKGTKLHNLIIADSYSFIKHFDNALQGYLNSDRQFLEFPGHHVSIYDLPVKLGTLYVNFINKAVAVFEKSSLSKVSFLLCPEPSYAEGPHSEFLLSGSYSSGDKTKPHPGICVIATPADSLFNPKDLLLVLAHEVAHFVNRDLRAPEKRNKLIYDLNFAEFKDKLLLAIDRHLTRVEVCDPLMHQEWLKEKNNFYSSIAEIFPKLNNIFEGALNHNTAGLSSVSFSDLRVNIDNLFDSKNQYFHGLVSKVKKNYSAFLKKLPVSVRFQYENLNGSIETELEAAHAYYINSSREIDYLLKECVADVLSIQLLSDSIAFDNYRQLLREEIDKEQSFFEELHQSSPEQEIQTSSNHETTIEDVNKSGLQMLRLYLIEKVFSKNLSYMLNSYKDPFNDCYEGFNRDSRIFISKETLASILEYLKHVKNGFSCNNDNDARKMYSDISKAQSGNGIDTSVLVKYML